MDTIKKLLLTVGKSLVFLILWAVLLPLVPDLPTANPAWKRLWWELTPFAGVALLTALFVWGVERNRIRVPMLAHGLRNAWIGLVTGVVWLGSVVALLWLTGTLRFSGMYAVPLLWVWLLSCLLNVAMQELLVRGYLYRLCKNNYNTAVAIVVTTLLFTGMHGGAFSAGPLAVFNVVTMSVFASFLLEYTGTLLAPILVHFVWNAVGAIVLGGVSLASDYPKLLNAVFEGNSILSGGVYRLEGSVVTLAANLALAALFGWLMRRRAHNR